ncbi:MAG: PEP-CTERM sorting domain-containing protein [Myxococcota bacterium]
MRLMRSWTARVRSVLGGLLVATLVATLAATLVATLGATDATAVEFAVTSSSPGALNEGDVVTIDIVMTNSSQTEIIGLAASVWGWDRENVQFLGGEAVFNYFNRICVGPGQCFNGVQNFVGGPLVESETPGFGPRVQFVLSYGLGGISNSGVGVDQGLDGQVGTAMFTLRFSVLQPSQTTLLIDTFYPGDGVVLPGGAPGQSVGSTVDLVVVPEPSTGVLLVLGLVGLSRHRTPRRS